MTAAQRRKRDIAYGCFLFPAAAGLIEWMLRATPIDKEAAAVLAFLVLVPLTIAALAAIAIGVFLAIVLWRDGVLPILSILTILAVAEIATEAGSVQFYNATGPIYGTLVLLLEATWFLLRRRRINLT